MFYRVTRNIDIRDIKASSRSTHRKSINQSQIHHCGETYAFFWFHVADERFALSECTFKVRDNFKVIDNLK